MVILAARGRKPAEEHLKNLMIDIEEICNPTSQTDPTFHTARLYTPLTAKDVRGRLIEPDGVRTVAQTRIDRRAVAQLVLR